MPINAVILDANLLVLLVVGMASPAYITSHKRLRAYGVKDFQLLRTVLSTASRVIVTPNIVTEASNLAGQISEPARARIFAKLRALLTIADERYVASRQATENTAFLRLGITDAAVMDAMDIGATLLTSDLDLYREAARQGRTVVNFNHYIAANG
jgi:hypothetical protein